MRLRSLSVALLAGVALVPMGGSAASAADGSVASGVTSTFKTSAAKRAKRAALSAPVQAPRTVAPTAVPGPTAVSYASRVLTLTNAERTSRGLRALSFSSCADGFANSWALQLAAAGSLSHQPLSPILIACSARGVGENVAFGTVSPEQLVGMWMGSTGHRANILNPAFTHVGVGDVTTSTGRTYGVQVFLTL